MLYRSLPLAKSREYDHDDKHFECGFVSNGTHNIACDYCRDTGHCQNDPNGEACDCAPVNIALQSERATD